MARTFLLDGTALAYRSHFALAAGREGGLTTTDGHPTSASFGFTMTLRAILKREQVDRIAVAFDGPSKDLERTRVFPAYKATREKAPDELRMQFDDVRAIVSAYGIPILELEGQEADDVIGTLAVRCREAGDEVFIVTGDKDFMQLVDDAHVRLYDIMRRGSAEPKIYTPREVEEKFGVPPAKIVDLLALMGDSSDNIPGVPGVGPKTAAALLTEYGSLDAVLERASGVAKPKLRETLIEHRDQALLSRELVRIRTDLDIEVAPTDLHGIEPDRETLLALFRRLEFRQFVDELMKESVPVRAQSVHTDYRIAESLEECRAIARRLETSPAFTFDALTEPGAGNEERLLGLAFSNRAGRAWYVPLLAPDLPRGHDRDAWLACFAPVLGAARDKGGHDVKPSIKVLQRHGVRVGKVAFDSMLAAYCVAPGQRRHDLASLANHYFELHRAARSDLTGTGRKSVPLSAVSVHVVGPWAAEAADLAFRLREPLAAELGAFGVEAVFRDIEMPLVPVLADIEERGVRIDSEYLHDLGARMQARIEELTATIQNAAGEEFNIASNQQLGQILFEKLMIHKERGVRAPKKTRTGQWATDHTTLEKLAPHPLIDALLEYRRLTKLKGTYADALPLLVRSSTGRIHTSFNQAVAATGRLSSEDPNLQNIPIRTEDGRQLRRAFVAGEPGWVLISADYSQIELRILAHVSGDTNLQAGFRSGQDVHTRTASIVFGVMPQLVDTTMRSQAKVVNYGLVYGMGVQRLASETSMSQPEARKFMDRYFAAMPRVKEWLEGTLASARETGEVRTCFGRRRPVPDILSKAPGIRANAQNVAVNSPIQGTAADVIKRAMITLHAAIEREQLAGRLLLQVHDELVLECPEHEVERLSALVRECMEGAASFDVPLEVEIGVGRTWLDAHG